MTHPQLTTPELAEIQVHGFTRSSFILRGALAAGTVYGMGAVSPFVGHALAQGGGGDVDILNFALTLEYLEATFYKEAVDKVSGLDGDTLKLTKQLRDDEVAHVDALTATIKKLGGEPVPAPKVDFGKAFASKAAYLKTANVFEDTGVSAYNGAAPMIENKDVLSAAGTIVQIEARHAALIRLARGKEPAPIAFDKTSTMDEVLTAVKPFIKS